MTDKTRLKRLERIRTRIDHIVDTYPKPGEAIQRKRELELLFRQGTELNPNYIPVDDLLLSRKQKSKAIQLSLSD